MTPAEIAAQVEQESRDSGLTPQQVGLYRWVRADEAHGQGWLEKYQASTGLASRDAVLTVLEHLQPWYHLVELGCHNGPMLTRIHERWPKAQLFGVEINKLAAEDCKVCYVDVADFREWLTLQPDNAVDIVMSHYALCYTDPNEMKDLIGHCVRVARKAVVLAEPTGETELTWVWPEWRHPFDKILRESGVQKVLALPLNERTTAINVVLAGVK